MQSAGRVFRQSRVGLARDTAVPCQFARRYISCLVDASSPCALSHCPSHTRLPFWECCVCGRTAHGRAHFDGIGIGRARQTGLLHFLSKSASGLHSRHVRPLNSLCRLHEHTWRLCAPPPPQSRMFCYSRIHTIDPNSHQFGALIV